MAWRLQNSRIPELQNCLDIAYFVLMGTLNPFHSLTPEFHACDDCDQPSPSYERSQSMCLEMNQIYQMDCVMHMWAIHEMLVLRYGGK